MSIPVLGSLLSAFRDKKREHARRKHRRLGNDPNRAEGDRPYKDMDEDTLRSQYRSLGNRIRNSEGGFGLSPLIDRQWNLRKELEHRGIDPEDVWNPDEEGGDA